MDDANQAGQTVLPSDVNKSVLCRALRPLQHVCVACGMEKPKLSCSRINGREVEKIGPSVLYGDMVS